MFNKEWKQSYLNRNDFLEDDKKTIELSFKDSELIENKFNIDLSRFNIPQVKELLNYTDNKYTKIYCDYCCWCLRESYTVYINPYDIFLEDKEEWWDRINVLSHRKGLIEMQEVYTFKIETGTKIYCEGQKHAYKLDEELKYISE